MNHTLAAIIRSANDAIVTANAEGAVVTWNPAAERIFGYRESEILGRPLTLLMPERFRRAHDAGLGRVVATGETRVIGKTVELAGLRKDGSEFPIELSLATWEAEGARFFSGIVRDVTDRKRLAAALEGSEERTEAILRTASDAIVCADERGCVVLWNPAAERLFGYRAEEMHGKSLTRIIPERYRQAHEAGIERVRSTGVMTLAGRTVELTALRGDGSEVPIELSLATWTTVEGRYFGGIIRDVTDRKRAERDLRAANQALNEKNEELQALSAKLAKYLSQQVYDSIFSGRTEVRVESYRKSLTVFFSDIQGFTELTDSIEAEVLSDLLNQYLSEMSAIALQYGGTIDKFIGDGIMIFFGDPETRGAREDALACVHMALAMRERVRELRHDWNQKGISRPLHVRIGINSGFCTVGNFGSEHRLDYTIVGGQVNAAARLEASAEADQILISHPTYALIRDEIHCEPIGEIKVKGIAHPLRTYEVISRRSAREPSRSIVESGDGFRLALDPGALSGPERQRVRDALRAALLALEGEDGAG
jgi:adenylate cyclase